MLHDFRTKLEEITWAVDASKPRSIEASRPRDLWRFPAPYRATPVLTSSEEIEVDAFFNPTRENYFQYRFSRVSFGL